MTIDIESSSFRDRDGFIFYKNGSIYRAIQPAYKNTWDLLTASSFFNDLIKENKTVSFTEEAGTSLFPGAYKILNVQKIPFVSYPVEWTFAQLKKAALLTLSIQKKALQHNFTLKDASAYNIQFIGNKAIFIDTLSFDQYKNGEPWHAYKQFCQHFLGPLLLCHYGLAETKSLFLTYIDGIPLNISSALLPLKSRFNLLAYTHIHLHARFEKKHAAQTESKKTLSISKARSLTLIEHLEQGIKSLEVKKTATNWTDYYESFSYSANGYAVKKAFIEKHAAALKNDLCVDLGANTGEFSELVSKHFNYVMACDNDAEVVSAIQLKKIKNLLPLHVDLTNPTPAFGWNSTERQSFIERIKKADLTLALALVHHLCIGNNVPLAQLAGFFADTFKYLIIEFVPKTDVQVKKLLVTKKDIFDDYTSANFKLAFSKYFTVLDQQSIPDSEREIFLLKKTTVL